MSTMNSNARSLKILAVIPTLNDDPKDAIEFKGGYRVH